MRSWKLTVTGGGCFSEDRALQCHPALAMAAVIVAVAGPFHLSGTRAARLERQSRVRPRRRRWVGSPTIVSLGTAGSAFAPSRTAAGRVVVPDPPLPRRPSSRVAAGLARTCAVIPDAHQYRGASVREAAAGTGQIWGVRDGISIRAAGLKWTATALF